MRFVPIECVRKNSILGKSIYDCYGRKLLNAGVVLTENMINNIKNLDIYSLYIIDEYSSEEIEDVIKPELRIKAVSVIKETFKDIERVASVHKFERRSMKDYSKKEQEYFNSISDIAEELLDNVLSSHNVLLSLVDIKSMDDYTYAHCVNVAVISIVLGMSLSLTRRDLLHLCMGALIHDIGKVFIPSEILQKPGKLTPEEFAIIKKHSRLGYDFIKNSYSLSAHSKLIVLEHHERFDGLGYPDALAGDKITYLSRIVTIADVYDALTSDRPYKRAMCPSLALEYLMSNAGTLFDFSLVNVFCKIIIPYPKGTIVSLSNGDIGVVEQTLPNFPLRPIVKIVKSNSSTNNVGDQINLIDNLSIVISDIKYEV